MSHRKIFFSRHARDSKHDSNTLSEYGKELLERLRVRLDKHDFHPQFAVTTTAARGIESARLLLPEGVVPRCLKSLRVSASFYEICDQKDRSHSPKKYARALLQEILSLFPSDGDILVIGHDCMPSLLTLAYSETKGSRVTWKPQEKVCAVYQDLDYATGFLCYGITTLLVKPTL